MIAPAKVRRNIFPVVTQKAEELSCMAEKNNLSPALARQGPTVAPWTIVGVLFLFAYGKSWSDPLSFLFSLSQKFNQRR